jgi:cellulose synthase/poly-beta-1,6-N-acetylglucosamine synthase-like glycosyltransferase
MDNKPFISIVIPVRDFERTIDKSFEYLLNIDYPHKRWEIIIADGGSKDKTLDIILQWQKRHDFIKLIKIPGCPSPAIARNKALEIVKGEYIFFTDGDCAPCRDWVNIMLSRFAKDPRIGAVGGEIYTLKVDKDNLTEAYCEHFRFNMVSPRYGFIKEGFFPPLSDMGPTQIAGHRAYFFITANVAYRKESLNEVNAKFWDHPTGEDMDMCLQIEKRGWKLYFAPDAKVDHMHRSNFTALRKVWAGYAGAHPALIKKYASSHFEVVLQFIGSYPNNPVLSIPSPIKGFLYLGSFHLMHIFGFIFIAGLISLMLNPESVRLLLFTLAVFSLGIYSAYKFYYWCWFMKPRKYFFTWCKMKYLTNLSFIAGGLKESGKYKVFCVEPSF